MSTPEVSIENKSIQPKQLESAPENTPGRHRIGRGIGALGLGMVLGVNALNSIGNVIQNDNPPEIRTYSSSNPSTEALVAFSGLGGYGSDLYCTLNAIDPRDVWGVFHNGSFDLELESQMIVEKAKQSNIEELTLLGDSAGGQMAIKVTAEIAQTSPIKVSEVHLVTTPISIDNIRPKERLAFKTSGIALLGGFTARLAGETAVEINKDYQDGWIDSIKSVWERSTFMPTSVLKRQHELVKQGVSAEDIGILVANGTKIVYFAPNQTSQDSLIDTDLAYQELKEMVLKGMKEHGLNSTLLEGYLSLVRVGNKHSMIALSEPELVDGGVWTNNTNAPRTNNPYEIKQLVGTDNDCDSSYRDVIAALGIA